MLIKFDQKQLHLMSQLFMAAAKAGHAFDLARLTKDADYANAILVQLSQTSRTAHNEQLQALVQLGLQVMADVVAAAKPKSSLG
jgi:hypothetical protein